MPTRANASEVQSAIAGPATYAPVLPAAAGAAPGRPRRPDAAPGERQRGPGGDRGAGDVRAVVAGVGELGQRSRAGRQARVDDLDAEAQALDGALHLGARVGALWSCRQVACEL